MQHAVEEAEARAAAAGQQAEAAAAELARAQDAAAAAAKALAARYEPQVAELRQEVERATEGAEAANRSVERGWLGPCKQCHLKCWWGQPTLRDGSV